MKVAFIGSVGVPNCYGGFESFLDAVIPRLKSEGADIYVTCDSGRYSDQSREYKGINRIFLSISANGVLSPLHDFIAFLKVLPLVKNIVVLGVSAGPFFILMRAISLLLSKKLIVNIDGVEWRRSKYSGFAKCVLWLFDFCAQLSANYIVYDNAGLKPYIYKYFAKKAVLIPYSGDTVLHFPNVDIDASSALTICRIEPENNIEMLINGALQSKLKTYTIIGNWNHSEFGRKIKIQYSGHETILLLDPIYDSNSVALYRERADIYLHGHSVGGTNPSLVEMLSYRCKIIAFDCIFNRETAGIEAEYFRSSTDLSSKIDAALIQPSRPSGNLPERYQSAFIAKQYLALFVSQ
jgi:hypothetical protein